MLCAGHCVRGLRRVAICAALGLTTIRLNAQRIDELALGASRVSVQMGDSIAASDTVRQLTLGIDAVTGVRTAQTALFAGTTAGRPDKARKCGEVVPFIAIAALGALVAGSVRLAINDFDGDGNFPWRKIVVPVAVVSVVAIGIGAVACNW